MLRRRLLYVLLAVPAAGIVGCGSSSSHSSSQPAAAPSRSTSTALAPAARRRHHRSHRQTTAPTTSSGGTATAPPQTPAGTATPPDGLRATSGYSTYELCSGTCSGSVPAALLRPLHLPRVASGAACPTSGGGGPVRPQSPSHLRFSPFLGSAWRGARVTWVAAAGYGGPVLIRGKQLDGPHAVGFGEGHVPYDELQLLDSGMGAPRQPGGGRAWLTITRVRGPGCYAYQIDGTSFSSVLVFAAS